MEFPVDPAEDLTSNTIAFPSEEGQDITSPLAVPEEAAQYKAMIFAAAEDGALLPSKSQDFLNSYERFLVRVNSGAEAMARQHFKEQEQHKFVMSAGIEELERSQTADFVVDAQQQHARVIQMVAQKFAEKEQFDAEVAAARNIIAMGAQDPYLATIMQYQMEHGEGIDQLQEMMEKKMVFHQAILEQNKLLEDRIGPNWMRNAWDAITASFEFGTDRVGLFTDKPAGVKSFINVGGREVEERTALWSLPIDQFREVFPKWLAEVRNQQGWLTDNELSILNRLEEYSKISEDDIIGINGWIGFDVATSMSLISLSKATNGIKNLLNLAGNTPFVARETLNALKGNLTTAVNKTEGKDAVSNAVANSVPGFQTPVSGTPSPALAAHIQKAVDEQDAMEELAKQFQMQTGSRLTQEELTHAIENTLEKLNSQLQTVRVKNWVPVQVDDVGKANQIKIFLGTTTEKAFPTKKAAEAAQKKLGLTGKGFAIEGSKGEWFLTATKAVDETGVIQVMGLEEMSKVGLARWFLAGAGNTLPKELYNKGLAATIAKTGFYENVLKPFERYLSGFNKERRMAIGRVLTAGSDETKWYTKDEFVAEYTRLNKKAPMQEDFLAYRAMQKINDIDHFVRNKYLKLELETTGEKEIFFNKKLGLNVERLFGKQISTPNELRAVPLTSQRIYDVEGKRTIHPGTMTHEQLIEMVERDGLTLVRLFKHHRFDKTGGDVVYIMGKRKNVGVRELPETILPYKAGGHREYDTAWFIKQTRQGKYTDGAMEEYLKTPGVWMAGNSARELAEIAKQMDAVRLAYRKVLNGQMTQDTFEITLRESPWENMSYDDFKRLVDDGNIDLDNPFEVVFDRELPESTKKLMSSSNIKSLVNEEGPMAAVNYYENMGRMYYSRKGEGLIGPNGQRADIIDPFKTTAKALGNVQKLAALSNYKLTETARWAKAAKDYLAPGQTFSNEADVFFNGVLRPIKVTERDYKTIQALEQYRNRIKHTLGFKSSFDHYMEAKVRELATSFDAKGMDRLRDWTFNIGDSNPVRALKALNYDFKLGFWAPAQLFLQAQTSFAALSVSPILGLKGFQQAPLIKAALLNNTDNGLDYIAKKFSALHGTEPQDFKDMVRAFKNSGFANIGAEMALVDRGLSSVGQGPILSTITAARQSGRIFINASEQWNRIVGWSMAWNKAKKAGKNLKDSNVLVEVLGDADKYTMNMTTAGQAAWQRGGLSIPTQFMGYQARLLEAMAPVILGGSKQFTTAEKVRLFAGQAALYGSAGVPFGDFIADSYFKSTGEEINPDMYRAVTRGLWDSMVFGITGAETDFSVRAGSGAGWSQFFSKWTSDFSSTAPLELLAGPSGGVVTGITESVFDVARMLTFGANEGDVTITVPLFERLAQNLTSFNDIQKSILIYNTGKILSKQGDLIQNVEELKEAYAIFNALGFKAASISAYYDYIKDNSDFQKDINDTASKILSTRVLKAMYSSDAREREKIHTENKLMVDVFSGGDPIVRREIADKVLGYIPEQAFDEAMLRSMKVKGNTPFNNLMMDMFERQTREEQKLKGR